MTRFAAALTAAAAIFFVGAGPAFSQQIKPTPIPAHHPLVGEWLVEVPGTQCHERRRIKADGTFQVWSGQEISENVFAISASPGKNGFYKLVDQIVKDNGKPDCIGEIMQLGHVATTFIVFSASGDRFRMCEQADTKTCFATFIRQKTQ